MINCPSSPLSLFFPSITVPGSAIVELRLTTAAAAMAGSKPNTERGLEDNILAMLDSSGIRDSADINDDRLAFMEAVRSVSLLPNRAIPLSRRVYGEVFHILRDSNSMELAVASFQLLMELDECYPRVHLTHSENSGGSKIVVAEEAWSPFIASSENAIGNGNNEKHSDDLLDSTKFSLLIQDIAQGVHTSEAHMLIKFMKDMLLFQYLINVLGKDFIPRQALFKESLDWIPIRESIINIIWGSRRVNFKSLVRDCMSIMCRRSHCHIKMDLMDSKSVDKSSVEQMHNKDVALVIAINELETKTFEALEKLMIVIMEFDALRQQADLQGLTTRADGVRTPLMEIILDELTYSKDKIASFLKAFFEPRWKLEIVLQYFSKYFSKPSVRTRRTASSLDETTFESILSLFSTPEGTKNIAKKISSEVARLLIVHGFQTYFPPPNAIKDNGNTLGGIQCHSIRHVCTGLFSAFDNLKKIGGYTELTPFEKEALFTAAVILSNTPCP